MSNSNTLSVLFSHSSIVVIETTSGRGLTIISKSTIAKQLVKSSCTLTYIVSIVLVLLYATGVKISLATTLLRASSKSKKYDAERFGIPSKIKVSFWVKLNSSDKSPIVTSSQSIISTESVSVLGVGLIITNSNSPIP